MKKILFLAFALVCLAVFSPPAEAQKSIKTLKASTGKTFDTLTNAGTGYFVTTLGDVDPNSPSWLIGVKATNISGVTGYKLILQGSVDGTNYDLVHGTAGTNWVACDSLLTTGSGYNFVRVKKTGTGNAGWYKYFKVVTDHDSTGVTRFDTVQIQNE